VFYRLSARARDQGDGRLDGRQADHLRDGESRSGDHRRGGSAEVRTTAHHGDGRRTIPTRSQRSRLSPFCSAASLRRRASQINMEMKIAAARASQRFAARRTDEVAAVYGNAAEVRSGLHHPDAVRPRPFLCATGRGKAAMDTGVARSRCRHGGLTSATCARAAIRSRACWRACFERLQALAQRVVFAEGARKQVIRAR